MKKRNNKVPYGRRSPNEEENWKPEPIEEVGKDFLPRLIKSSEHTSTPPKPKMGALPSADAILARLRVQPSSLDDLIGHFQLKKLAEQTALENRLLELATGKLIQVDLRGRLLPARVASALPLAPDAPALVAPPQAGPAPKTKQPKPVLDESVPVSNAAETAVVAPKPVLPVETTPPPVQAAEVRRKPLASKPYIGETRSGKVSSHRDGFGFVSTEIPGEDVFLPVREMRGVMNGDRITVRITEIDATGRLAGAFVSMVSAAPRFVIGLLRQEQGRYTVTPDNQKAQPFELAIPHTELMGARAGQVVRAEIVTAPGSRGALLGRVTEILGNHLDPGLEIEIALRRHDLPAEFSPEVLALADSYGEGVRESDLKGRVDLRAMPLVTIDGADARDFDDAVYAEAVKGGFRLVVAIADVSAYVRIGDDLDEEASKRGTSVYFPRRVIPMLPEALSNGLCSLNPDVDRLCLVADMRVSPDGEVTAAKFVEAVIRSHARLIYDDVAKILDEPEGPIAQAYAHVIPQLVALNAVFDALFAARLQRGAIDFDSQETKFEFNHERKIERIVPVVRNRAHRLIEECMIAANVEAAKFVGAKETPALYRVHEQPDPQRVVVLKEFLALRAMSLGGGEAPAAKDFAQVSEAAKAKPDTHLIQMMILRTMSQARYAPEALGHFGLALEHYAHFTSPIRRYPDLLLHRAIKHIIKRRKPSTFAYSFEQMDALGTHCSMTERRADDATRDVASWLKCEYMSHRVGHCFAGVISGVTNFGLFVDLTGLYIDGLIHASVLGEETYQFDQKNQSLIGRRSGHTYKLGQPVYVQVVRVHLEERKIDLILSKQDPSNSEAIQRSATNSSPSSRKQPKVAATEFQSKKTEFRLTPSKTKLSKKRR